MKNSLGKMIIFRHKVAHKISYLIYILCGAKKRNEKELLNLKNKYSGKRFFIVCSGPSLKAEDLTKIYENGDISIGMNTIAKIYHDTPWRPTFLSATDDVVFNPKNRKMVEECEAGYKIYDATRYIQSKRAKGRKIFLSFDESLELLDNPVFSSDALKKLPSIGTSVYSIIEFAVFLGCKEFYILGCDLSYAVNQNRDGSISYNDSGKNHFYAKEEDSLVTTVQNPVQIWQLQIAYDFMAKYAKQNNIKILNATRGGKLESFPRVDFDTLFV